MNEINNEVLEHIIRRAVIKRRILLAIILDQNKKPCKKRKQLNKRNRTQQDDWNLLVQEMRLGDTELFFNTTRLSVQQFDYLLALIGPKIKKFDTRRDIIPERSRLSITLRHLVTGDSLSSMASAYRIGKSTACGIIKETCQVLCEVLLPIYIKCPEENDWKEFAADFNKKCNLPHCVGAIDVKHVNIQTSSKCRSQRLNYDETFNTILFAVCNAHLEFTYVDINAYDSQSDGGLLRESSFGLKLLGNELHLPAEEKITNTELVLSYFFVGNETFPLLKNLLKPYGGHHVKLPQDKLIFNYRLSRTRRCIENAFGVMISRFNILHHTIRSYPETADVIVQACMCLHNFIKKTDRYVTNVASKYCPTSYVDDYDQAGNLIPGDWRENIAGRPALTDIKELGRRVGTRNASRDANQNRDDFTDYINSEIGKVPWQDNYKVKQKY